MQVPASSFLTLLWFILAAAGGSSLAAEAPVRVVVSFSILDDIAREIGGDDVAVTSLIGRDANEHVFEPSPDQVRLVAQARLFIVNGLSLEGWLTRLVQSARYREPVVVATESIVPITTTEAGGAAPSPDPHAWQDARNGVIYA